MNETNTKGLANMSRIDTSTFFNDEFSYATVIYLVIGIIIIYIAWLSTYVRNETRDIPYRQRTVFIFNQQTGDFQQHTLDILLNNLSSNLAQATPTFESILDEMNGISYRSPHQQQQEQQQQQQDDNTDDDMIIEDETQEIIREMDRDSSPNLNYSSSGTDINSTLTDGIRNRRTTNSTNMSISTSTSIESMNTSDSVDFSSDIAISSLASNNSNEGNSTQSNHVSETIDPNLTLPSTTTSPDAAAVMNGTEITIKLKYLNDDLKIVKAWSNEAIGDFIKRHFSEELSSQKVVRLVFNGHVLQPDGKTISACGLFDNCVVHCLIHNPRPAIVPESSSLNNNPSISNEGTTEQIGRNNLINSTQNRNRNTQRLLNLSLFLICLSVIISWFFRIQYFQLFSWYSTVGLVLLTTFFLVIIPLIFLIEREIFRNL